jgi:glycosyltransferase involved in cell wall biosynthesis
MKTVIQVVQHLQPGGIETLVLELIRFKAQGERHYIVSLEGSKHEALAHWPRLKSVADNLVFMEKQPGKDYGLLVRLVRLFKALNADVVHTHHIGPLLYAGLAARLGGHARLIHTEHDAWHLADSWRCKLQRFAMRAVRPVMVADAQSVAKGMRTYLRTSADAIIPNGIDTQKFLPGCQRMARQQLGLPRSATLVGCSGRLEWEKGHRYLIEALAMMPASVHLAIAGQGSRLGDLTQQVKQLGLERRVHFLGSVDDMPLFYQSLDLFCQPSLKEGMPLSPLEAQACGVPTVVTATGGSRESLCLDTGKIVRRRDARGLATGLKELFNRAAYAPFVQKKLGSPREFVERQGDIRRTAAAYARLYQLRR